MNLKSLIALIALFLLVGCAHSVKGDWPANDLDALESSARQEVRPRTLPNGKEYCAELAKTEDAQDKCLGDLEDLVFVLNRSMERAQIILTKGFERLRLERLSCSWFDFTCKARKKALDQVPTNFGANPK